MDDVKKLIIDVARLTETWLSGNEAIVGDMMPTDPRGADVGILYRDSNRLKIPASH